MTNEFRLAGEFYHGASGSPILNSNDEIVGILLAGKDDYVKKASGSCMTANIEVNEHGGEEALYLADDTFGLDQ